jgi:hypothetical protein
MSSLPSYRKIWFPNEQWRDAFAAIHQAYEAACDDSTLPTPPRCHKLVTATGLGEFVGATAFNLLRLRKDGLPLDIIHSVVDGSLTPSD